MKRGFAVVHVIVPTDDPRLIAGYHTLSSVSVELADLPPEVARRVPYRSVPGFLLGRLAVATAYQGKGLGGYLLSAAFRTCRDVAAKYVAGRIVVVDALDEGAAAFYRKYGFAPLETTPGYPARLMLPVASLPPPEGG